MVDVIPDFLSNESTSPRLKEIARNGVPKSVFDSGADTIEAFGMICLHILKVSAQKIFKVASRQRVPESPAIPS